MDLADFPRLRTLYLESTPAVTGDIRDIGADDFSKLEQLVLPSTVYGGDGYELHRISDAPELMKALYFLKKQHPSLMLNDWAGKLSEDSPDWYLSGWDEEVEEASPPFCISLVVAGCRVGYRWRNDAVWRQRCQHCDLYSDCCEVIWIDPEPDKDSSDYAKYVEELQEIENEVDFYKGFHQPPTEEEYIALCEAQ